MDGYVVQETRHDARQGNADVEGEGKEKTIEKTGGEAKKEQAKKKKKKKTFSG